jgi:RND family efflux transporter MFP subunit
MDQELQQKQALVEEARAAVGQARANLLATQAVVVAAEASVAEANAKIAQYEAEIEFRRSEHSRFVELAERGSVQSALVDEKLNWLRSAESALASARAGVSSAQANLDVEKARIAQAEAGLKHSEARLQVAQADLQQTEILMGYAKIVAPYDGNVSRRWVDTGDFVASAADSKSEPLLTVVRTDILRIVSDIPESESSMIREGQPVSFVVDALKGRQFTGNITRTAGVLDPKTRTLRIQVEHTSAEAVLRPGMFGMLTATLADHPAAVMLATGCIRYSGDEAYVLCVSDGIAEKHSVKVGYSDGTRTEVLEGVAPADEIISESRSPVRPGQRVDVVANR